MANDPGSAALGIFDSLINRVKQAHPVRSDGKPLGGGVVYSMMTLGMPVDPRDYKTAPTAAELARLKAVFPTGVCDWSKPGIAQVPVVTWASYGPSPKNRIFDVTRP